MRCVGSGRVVGDGEGGSCGGRRGGGGVGWRTGAGGGYMELNVEWRQPSLELVEEWCHCY